ncbi:MAG: hypothetical protein MJY57_02515 [Bacteroidales bacterium]|nr:hypothetical protein [Bacteroidales bacterium]
MDTALLSKMVTELVLDHSQVGLPGIGTFFADVVPASFSDRGYTINPPYRRLTFIPGKGEDDLLIDLYAKSNSLKTETAKVIVNAYLADLRKELSEKKIIELEGLGRLRATRQNSFFFVADPDLDIFPEGIGLESVSLRTRDWVKPSAATVDVPESVPKSALEAPEEGAAAIDCPVHCGDRATLGNVRGGTLQGGVGAADVSAVEPGNSSGKDLDSPGDNVEAENIQAAVDVEESAYTVAAIDDPVHPGDRATLGNVRGGTLQGGVDAVDVSRVEPDSSSDETVETGKRRRWWWITPLAVVAVLAIALALFLILVKVAPDFIDSLLYTPEELRIINY